MRLMVMVLVWVLAASPSLAALENLDEAMARKSRLGSATWGYSLLENSSNNYTWQPETLQYTDATTSNEVWRLTYTPSSLGGGNHDIANTHWSANGNRLLIHSTRPTAGVNYYVTGQLWMLINSDGSRLKPVKGASGHLTSTEKYPMWSPVIPDVYYQGNCNDGQATSGNILYKNTVSDTTITRSAYLTLPASVTRTNTKKGISGDGRKAILLGFNDGKTYPVTLLPEASKALDTTSGYARQLAFDYYWGDTPSPWADYHDNYTSGAVNGADGIWRYIMIADADSSFWRTRLTGSGANGEPIHTQDHTPPYNWGGEFEPSITRTSGPVLANDPWCPQGVVAGTDCPDYPGHVSTDKWGRYLIYESTNRAPYGLAIHDARDHKTKSLNTTMQNGSHTDWEAWSDWSVSDGSALFGQGWNGPSGTKRVYIQNYLDTNSTKELAYTHANYNAGVTTTQSYTGPIQSPDGTKVQFVTSYMNNSDDHHQLFWTVAYYPYPPEIKSAAKNGANVRITWDFNQGTSCSSDAGTSPRTGPTPNLSTPRTYATRGWPHETLDCPPSPREIDKFRVWVSSDNITWTPAGTTTYNNCRGSNECGMWAETSWTYDYAQPNNSTRYYAVTSLEHSGLESRSLGNVWKVILDAGGAVTSQAQQTAYPATPGGKSNFYTTLPSAPVTAAYMHQKAPATTIGHYTVEWTAPASNTLIRHYNIYAKDGSAPTAIQQNRIASIAATTDYNTDNNFSYIDWLGNPNGTTQYLVTSVDYQGNENGITASEASPPTTTADKVPARYQTSQTVTLSASETATIKYCLTAECNPASGTTYSAPFKVLQNIALQPLRWQATGTTGSASVIQESIYRKQRMK